MTEYLNFPIISIGKMHIIRLILDTVQWNIPHGLSSTLGGGCISDGMDLYIGVLL